MKMWVMFSRVRGKGAGKKYMAAAMVDEMTYNHTRGGMAQAVRGCGPWWCASGAEGTAQAVTLVTLSTAV